MSSSSELIDAVRGKDHDVVQKFLGQKSNEASKIVVNVRDDESGKTALHMAAEMGHVCVVETLLQYGADLEALNESHRTPLMCAARNGHSSVVSLLLQHGANMETTDDVGSTALIETAHHDRKDTMKMLLRAGANVNTRNKHGQSVLGVAICWEDYQQVKLILEYGQNLDMDIVSESDSITLWLLATKQSPVDMGFCQSLLRHGVDTNVSDKATGKTVLMHAAIKGHVGLILTLLENGAAVDAVDKNGWTALWEASCGYNLNCMSVLLSKGANPNMKDNYGWTILTSGQTWQNDTVCLEKVKMLLRHKADPTIQNESAGDTALHLACKYGRLELISVLITEHQTDVNVTNHNGQTPLMHAVSEGHDEVVGVLLYRFGAVAAVRRFDGCTALHLAVRQAHVPIVEMLLRYEMKDADGRKQGNVSSRRLANIQNQQGETPLHGAARCANMKLLRLLLSHGADCKVTNKAGRTGLQLAIADKLDVAVYELLHHHAAWFHSFVDVALDIVGETCVVGQHIGEGENPRPSDLEESAEEMMDVDEVWSD